MPSSSSRRTPGLSARDAATWAGRASKASKQDAALLEAQRKTEERAAKSGKTVPKRAVHLRNHDGTSGPQNFRSRNPEVADLAKARAQAAQDKREREVLKRALANQMMFIQNEMPNLKYGKATVKRLEGSLVELYKLLQVTKPSKDDADRIRKLTADVTKHKSKIANTQWQEAFKQIEADSAKRFDKYAESIQDLKTSMRKSISDMGASMLQSVGRIGIGPLTVGNAFKVARGAYRATRWAGGAASALASDAYTAYKHKRAFAQSSVGAVPSNVVALKRPSPDEEAVSSRPASYGKDANSKKIYDLAAYQARSTKSYRNKLLSALSKHTDTVKQAAKKRLPSSGKGLLGSAMSLGGSALGAIKDLFGTLGGAGKGMLGGILPAISKFLTSPVGLLLGAAAAGWGIGSWINDKFGSQISEAIDKTVDWIGERMTALKAWASDIGDRLSAFWGKLKGKFQAVRDTVSSGVSGAWSAVKSTAGDAWDTVSSTPAAKMVSEVGKDLVGSASSAVSSAASTVSSAASSAGSSIASAASAGYDYAKSAVSSGIGKVSDFMGKLFSKGQGVDVDGLHPAVQSNLVSMAKEYNQATGKTVNITSGRRDSEEQAKLYEDYKAGRRSKPAAPPGRSLHEFGYAADISSATANAMDSMGLLKKYGFERPIKGEPWHVQPVGASVAAAKKGVFSADFPQEVALESKAAPSSVGSGTASSSAASPGDFKIPPRVEDAVAEAAEEANTAMAAAGGAGGVNAKAGVLNIPQFSSVDGSLMALNLGMLAGG